MIRSAGLVVALAALAAATAHAHASAFGVAPTRACLVKHGADIQQYVNLPTPAQRSEALVGTLPAGGTPVFFYLVIGRDAADAARNLALLHSSMAPPPTNSNSWSGTKDNAAWTLISILDSPPPTSVRNTLVSCLTTGAPPTGTTPSPARYTRSNVALCLAQGTGNAAEVMQGAEIAQVAKFLLGAPLPASLAPHVLLAITHSSPALHDGLTILLVFGTSSTDARRLQAQLEKIVAAAPVWDGTKKNVGWDAYRHKGTTAEETAASKKLLAGCLP